MKIQNGSTRRSAGGWALMETMVAIILVTGLTVIGMNMMASSGAVDYARKTSDRLKVIGRAGERYIAANTPALIAAAGPTTPVVVTIADLKAGNYGLGGGFDALDTRYGQTYVVRITEPTAGKLDMMVISTGGDPIPGKESVMVANMLGGFGGFVPRDNANILRGGFGSINLASWGGSPGIGHVAYAGFVKDEATLDDSLKRNAKAGFPERNRMSTAIDMAGNNIASAGTVGANVVNANKVNLPAGDALQIGNSYYYGDGANSAIRQAGGLYIQSLNGAGPAPIHSVSSISATSTIATNGDMSANRTFTNEAYAVGWYRSQGDGGWYSERYGGGIHMTDGTWIRTYGGKSFYSSGEIRANRMSTEGRISSGEFVQINGQAWRGWGCDTGSFAREPDGTGLFCKNGVFQAMGGGPTSGYYSYLGVFTSTYVGYNTSAYTSQVIVSAQAYSCGNNGYSVQLYSNGVWVGTVQDNNRTDAKVGHATFNVPAGGSFQITPQYTSYCYTQAHVWQYTQT